MKTGEIKTCWNTEPLSVEFDAGRNAFEVSLSCEHHAYPSMKSVYIGQIKAIIENAKISQPWLIDDIRKWIGD